MGSWTIIVFLILAVLGGVGFSLGRRKRRTASVVTGIIGFSLALLGIVLYYLTQGAIDPLTVIILGFIPFTLGLVSVIIGASNPPERLASPRSGGTTVVTGATNGLALASIIVVWFSSIVGLILGHVALSQIKRTGEAGHGMALAAVIVGWVATGVALLVFLVAGVQYAALLNR